MKKTIYSSIFFFIFSSIVFGNQNLFDLGLDYKQDLTHSDYIEIQKKLRTIDINQEIKTLYGKLKGNYTTFEDFYRRCTKSLQQTLINPSKNEYPIKVFKKIGRTENKNCIVCYATYNGKYPEYVRSIEKELIKVGYNGYFLYYIGGWPNPTGKEIAFCAVPYSFKIFAMYEAYLLGCTNVLWMDAACLPLRNLKKLFKHIAKTGALLNNFPLPVDSYRFIFPQTRDQLLALTGTDVLNQKNDYVNTILFGLKMDTPKTKKLLKQYYQMVEMGTPFLSCFPEEWVLSAIIGQPEFREIRENQIQKLVSGSLTNGDNTPEEYQLIRKQGFYFFHRKGR